MSNVADADREQRSEKVAINETAGLRALPEEREKRIFSPLQPTASTGRDQPDAKEREFLQRVWRSAAKGRADLLARLQIDPAGPALDRGAERDFLDVLWQRGILTPDFAPENDTETAAQGDESRPAAPAPAMADPAMYERAFRQQMGNAEVVIQRTLLELRRLAVDPGQLLAYVHTELPNRITQAQNAGGSIDRVADLVILALVSMVQPMRDGLRGLVPKVRGFLEEEYRGQPQGERRAEWLASIGSLATVTITQAMPLPQGGDIEPELLGAVYSNFLPSTLVQRPGRWTQDDHQLLAVVLNNVVFSGEKFIRMLDGSHPPIGEGKVEGVRSIHRRLLAAGAGFEDAAADDAIDDASIEKIAMALGLDLFAAASSRSPFLRSFEQMDKIGTLVPLDETSPARTAFRVVAAMVRILARNKSQTATVFFNIGIELIGAAAASDRRTGMLQARALTNAIGLRWSLDLNEQMLVALVQGDGLNCAVNLFGAIAQLGPEPGTALHETASRAYSALQAHRSVNSLAYDEGDMARIEASRRMLDLRGNVPMDDPEATFGGALTDLLNVIASSLGVEQHWPGPSPDAVVWTAAAMRAVLLQWLDAKDLNAAFRQASDVAAAFARDKLEPEAVVRSIYMPLATGKVRAGGLGEPRFRHPSVVALDHAGLAERWEAALSASIQECPDLAAAVAETVQAALA